MKNKTTVIGLTGPTGSGKSEVASVWKEMGATIIDTDKIARIVVEPSSPCLQELVSVFSSEILQPDGSLNRQKLAEKAFSSKEKTEALTNITHPYILNLCRKEIAIQKEKGTAYVIIDAPLLFESKLNTDCDYTVAVIADEKMRKSRIMQRDQLSEKQAENRMRQQHDNHFYSEKADYVLLNNSDLKSLIKNAKEFLK